jgi:Na+/melibiose symporter-like transporter
VAVSLPAANLNFYVRDVLQSSENLGWFLSIYFISACCFIPLWKYSAKSIGMIKSWILSISGSVLTFSFAYFLTAENADYFYLVCFFSGACLGADLIMPPVILAKITSAKKDMISTYFSLWNLTTKASLMIAASSSLIFLGLSGYKPGSLMPETSASSIQFFYALLPCILKILTIFNLIRFAKKLSIYES